ARLDVPAPCEVAVDLIGDAGEPEDHRRDDRASSGRADEDAHEERHSRKPRERQEVGNLSTWREGEADGHATKDMRRASSRRLCRQEVRASQRWVAAGADWNAPWKTCDQYAVRVRYAYSAAVP